MAMYLTFPILKPVHNSVFVPSVLLKPATRASISDFSTWNQVESVFDPRSNQGFGGCKRYRETRRGGLAVAVCAEDRSCIDLAAGDEAVKRVSFIRVYRYLRGSAVGAGLLWSWGGWSVVLIDPSCAGSVNCVHMEEEEEEEEDRVLCQDMTDYVV